MVALVIQSITKLTENEMFDLNSRKWTSILALAIVGSLIFGLVGFTVSRFKNERFLDFAYRNSDDFYIWAISGALIFGLSTLVYFIFPVRKT